ncbi:MAG: glycosyltransferase family 4 protein [Cyanobacteria bacterium P01_D01_bin.105]
MTLPIAYLSFDVVPSHKGAAVHIESFVRSLARTHGDVALVTVATAASSQPAVNWPGVHHTVLPAAGKTLIDRVIHFRKHLQRWLQGKRFEIIQVRSIFEGMIVARQKQQFCNRLIFEVNGLPSIELKYRYPRVAEDLELMNKLLTQERICLEAADVIITPSYVTQTHLMQRGVSPERIQVIPNGVDLSVFNHQTPTTQTPIETMNMLYFGTLSAWQGVDLAIDALSLYRRDFKAALTIVGPAKGKQMATLEKLSRKLNVTNFVEILPARPQSALIELMHKADVIVAPLKANDRNLVQGCCPLKVIEGMASGTPVVTTNLPVVTDLGDSERHFLAVRPGSAKAIKDGMLRLRTDARLRRMLSEQGRQQVEQKYDWAIAHRALLKIYNHKAQHKSSCLTA